MEQPLREDGQLHRNENEQNGNKPKAEYFGHKSLLVGGLGIFIPAFRPITTQRYRKGHKVKYSDYSKSYNNCNWGNGEPVSFTVDAQNTLRHAINWRFLSPLPLGESGYFGLVNNVSQGSQPTSGRLVGDSRLAMSLRFPVSATSSGVPVRSTARSRPEVG